MSQRRHCQTISTVKAMQSSNEIHTLWDIFFPDDMKILSRIESDNRRFAYYTSVDTAKKIIENKEVWLRDATVMNDFSEISYGLGLLNNAWFGSSGMSFQDAANSVFSGIMDHVTPQFNHLKSFLPSETYLTCLSQHDNSEDQNGRLSMWRAYGDIALIIKNTPFLAVSDRLGVFSTPVDYLDQSSFNERLQIVAQAISDHTVFLRKVGEEVVKKFIVSLLFLAAIRTKHPGFAEEKEWRIYFRPDFYPYPENILTREVVVIHGVAQKIWKLPLKHDPENGLIHADIPSLLERIIIGPTQYPAVSSQAFVKLLEQAGVEDASKKVVVSNIPLRTRI